MCISYKYIFPMIKNVERNLTKDQKQVYIMRIRRDTAESKWNHLYPNIKEFSKQTFNDIQSSIYRQRDIALFVSDYYDENNEFFNKFNYNSNFSDIISKKSFEYSNKNYILNIKKFKKIVEGGGIENSEYFIVGETGSSILYELVKANHLSKIIACKFYDSLIKGEKKSQVKSTENYKRFLKTLNINNHILKGD